MHKKIEKELHACTNPAKAKVMQGFFKTAKGQYAAGDVFLGLTVPQQRVIAKKYAALDRAALKTLLSGKIHEHRLTALLILVAQFEKASLQEQKKIVDFYLANLGRVNNWDLVDATAPKILGAYLCDKPVKQKILFRLARSKNMWERRVSIVATYALIRTGKCQVTLDLARILFDDSHDLIDKAVGWMLREVGKRDVGILKDFLQLHVSRMSRTTLRYAIERFSPSERARYLAL